MKPPQKGGLSACAKHFPGKGHSPLDAHLRLPRIDSGWDEMRAVHLVPFVEAIAAGVHCVMTSHPVYPALDPSGVPATFSRRQAAVRWEPTSQAITAAGRMAAITKLKANRGPMRMPLSSFLAPMAAGGRHVPGVQATEQIACQPAGRGEKCAGKRNQRDDENEQDARAPTCQDKPTVTDAVDVAGGRNLEDDQQGHHARDQSQHGGARIERLCVEHHRAAQDNLERERVEDGEPVHVAQPCWERCDRALEVGTRRLHWM